MLVVEICWISLVRNEMFWQRSAVSFISQLDLQCTQKMITESDQDGLNDHNFILSGEHTEHKFQPLWNRIYAAKLSGDTFWNAEEDLWESWLGTGLNNLTCHLWLKTNRKSLKTDNKKRKSHQVLTMTYFHVQVTKPRPLGIMTGAKEAVRLF